MATKKKAAGTSGRSQRSGESDAPTGSVAGARPLTEEEIDEVRKTGSVDRTERAQALPKGQHPSRTHESNLVEVEEMRFTRVVDGRRYGPFSSDAPAEKRRVPESLVVTFNLKQSKKSGSDKAAQIETGSGGKRPAGIETPTSDPLNETPTEDDRLEAAEEAGRDQDTVLENRAIAINNRRQALIESGAIEGSEAERKRLAGGK
jgi:hypothetical protein